MTQHAPMPYAPTPAASQASPMPTYTLVVGGLLIALGVGGYVAGGMTPAVRTALIPAYAGVPLVLLGLVALMGDKARKHAMHVAVLVALLGVLATIPPILTRVLPGEATTLAVVSLLGMLVLCGTLVGLGVMSFINARRLREAR